MCGVKVCTSCITLKKLKICQLVHWLLECVYTCNFDCARRVLFMFVSQKRPHHTSEDGISKQSFVKLHWNIKAK